MSLGGLATAGAIAGRSWAESAMVDTCQVHSAGAGEAWDDEAGQYLPSPPVLKWFGPCRVSLRGLQPADADTGYRPVVQSQIRVNLPLAAPEPVPGQTVTVVSSGGFPTLVGAVLEVVAVDRASFLTAWRANCVEVA